MNKCILIWGFLILCFCSNGQNVYHADTVFHYSNKSTCDTIFDKDVWMKSTLSQFFDKLETEFQRNFNHPTPFVVKRILENNKYYAIDVEDTACQYRYTIISIKSKRCYSEKILKENEIYNLTLENVTKFSGLIGTCEIPFNVKFYYHGKKIKYKSMDNLNGPPVTTKDLKGVFYIPFAPSK